MNLGAFSISLTVKDLQASKDFYQKLGFEVFAGKPEYNYYIMKNGNALIGLFHGMFDKNILTFNPGWDESANFLDEFDDIRQIQAHLMSQGLQLLRETDPEAFGPGSISLIDPDGNAILIDQHV